MQINIRRGANQIGGSSVELTAANGDRIVLDLGLPLDAEENTPDLLPNIPGLRAKTADLLGIIISHPHQDHFGLALHIDPAIPVYMGAAAHRIVAESAKCGLPNAVEFKNPHKMKGFEPFTLGAFRITPYPVDHSTYDAYALLVEADGKRVFYSGDFRTHGRTAKRVEHILARPPKNVDVLLMEGSSLGRLGEGEQFETEADLEKEFRKVFKETKGLVMVQGSAQNIDRVVSIYRAAKEAGRIFVMSGYAGFIIKAIENSNLPNFTWPDVKKMVREPPHKPYEITAEEIAAAPSKYVVSLSMKLPQWLEAAGLFNPATLYIWSMWGGYKKDKRDFLDKLASVGVKITDIHTSGHADTLALQSFVAALKPARLVPIHTPAPALYPSLFGEYAKVEAHGDNESFEV